jgi:hypothetical protein
LRTTAEIRYRTRDAFEESDRPAVLLDRVGNHWGHRHDNINVNIGDIDVDTQLQPDILRCVRPSLDGLAKPGPCRTRLGGLLTAWPRRVRAEF